MMGQGSGRNWMEGSWDLLLRQDMGGGAFRHRGGNELGSVSREVWVNFSLEATHVRVSDNTDIPWVSELDAFFGGTTSYFGYYYDDSGLDEGE